MKFLKIPREALESDDVGFLAKGVFGIITYRLGANDSVKLTTQEISQTIREPERTVRRAIKELVDVDWVGLDNPGKGTANRFKRTAKMAVLGVCQSKANMAVGKANMAVLSYTATNKNSKKRKDPRSELNKKKNERADQFEFAFAEMFESKMRMPYVPSRGNKDHTIVCELLERLEVGYPGENTFDILIDCTKKFFRDGTWTSGRSIPVFRSSLQDFLPKKRRPAMTASASMAREGTNG